MYTLSECFHIGKIDLARVEQLWIQEVVHLSQEGPARLKDLLEIGDPFSIFGIFGVLEKHFAVSDDRIDRRTQLMAFGDKKGFTGTSIIGHVMPFRVGFNIKCHKR